MMLPFAPLGWLNTEAFGSDACWAAISVPPRLSVRRALFDMSDPPVVRVEPITSSSVMLSKSVVVWGMRWFRHVRVNGRDLVAYFANAQALLAP
jgi:hypothetical protein